MAQYLERIKRKDKISNMSIDLVPKEYLDFEQCIFDEYLKKLEIGLNKAHYHFKSMGKELTL